MAEQAHREEQTDTRYLEALLAMEVEEREHHTVARRIQDARLPRMRTLEEFDFSQSRVPATRIRGLAEGGYLERAEPIVLIGECGTGKTHLATGWCVARCRQKKRVRFTTAAGLINGPVEAQHDNPLRRALARWFRYEVIAIDALSTARRVRGDSGKRQRSEEKRCSSNLQPAPARARGFLNARGVSSRAAPGTIRERLHSAQMASSLLDNF